MRFFGRVGTSARLDVAFGAVAFVLPLAVYVYSAPFGAEGWDYGEAQTVPYILGIFHPTGFPLYTLIGWAFTHLVAISTVAWRMNVLSGLGVALAALALYMLARGFGGAVVAALAAALVFAFAQPAWSIAIHADAHAVLIGTIGATLVALQRALLRRSARLYVATAVLLGCGIAIHPNAIWLLPGVALGGLVLRRELRARGAGAALVAFLVPLVTYAYLPLRAWTIARWHLDPNDAPPLDGAGASVWGALRVDTWPGLRAELTGSQFGADAVALGTLDPRGWPGDVELWWGRATHELPLLVLVLAALGLIAVLVRRERTWPVLVAGFASIPFAVAYAAAAADIGRYLLPSFALAVALAPVGPRLAPAGRWRTVAVDVVALGLVVAAWQQFVLDRGTLRYHGGVAAQAAIDVVAEHTPDGAIVLTDWLTVTALDYGKYVENALGTRLIVLAWPDDPPATIRRWAAVRPVYVDGDFILRSEIPLALPPAWLHSVGTWHDYELFEVRPAPLGGARESGRRASDTAR